MKLRFQADNDFNGRILSATLRLEPAIDFQSATAAGLHGVPDDEVLARTADDGRVLVTHDRRTMPSHPARFIEGRHSPGVVIVSRNLSIGEPPSGCA